jgi:hypothetical protein
MPSTLETVVYVSRAAIFVVSYILYYFTNTYYGLSDLHSKFSLSPTFNFSIVVNLWVRGLPVVISAVAVIVRLGMVSTAPTVQVDVDDTIETIKTKIALQLHWKSVEPSKITLRIRVNDTAATQKLQFASLAGDKYADPADNKTRLRSLPAFLHVQRLDGARKLSTAVKIVQTTVSESHVLRAIVTVADGATDLVIGYLASLVAADIPYPCRATTQALLSIGALGLVMIAAQSSILYAYVTRLQRQKRSETMRVNDGLHASLHWARLLGAVVFTLHFLVIVRVESSGVHLDCEPVGTGENAKNSVATDGSNYVSTASYLHFLETKTDTVCDTVSVVGCVLATAAVSLFLSHIYGESLRVRDPQRAVDAQLAPFGLVTALWTCDADYFVRASETVLVLTSVCGAVILSQSMAFAARQYQEILLTEADQLAVAPPKYTRRAAPPAAMTLALP